MYVVAYDLSDDRRRTRLFKTLRRFGTSVQESVFECHLTVSQFIELRKAVEQVIDPRSDQVRYYNLCEECARRIQASAASRMTSDPAVIVI